MSSKKNEPAKKGTVVASVKSAVKNVVKKEKAKVEELKAISKKAESKVAELKTVSRSAKNKVKAKVEEIKKAVAEKAPEKKVPVRKFAQAVENKSLPKEKKAAAAVKTVKAAASKVVKAPVEKAKPVEAPSGFSPEYLVLMQRDPNFLHAFWEVKEDRLKKALGNKETLVLRLYDVSSDLTVRKNRNRKFRDIEIPADAKSWYVQNRGAVSLSATLGAKTPAGKFEPLVEAPAMQVFSYEKIQPESLKADNVFFKASLGGAGIGGFGSSGLSSQSVASWLEHLASSSESFFSGSLSSGALSSGSLIAQEQSPGSVNYGKDFFLWVKTRLIVYGGTRPDAHLQVRGEPFPLNPDGTFSFEQDLPDSTQIIPVFATDKDGDFPTTIVPIVIKRTE